MDRTELVDRRNAGTPQRRFSLDGQTLSWRDSEGQDEGAMALSDVRQVRLAVEMAGQQSQVVCRITDAAGREIAFGSMRWAGIGLWDANGPDFSRFLIELHRDLASQAGAVRYIEGASVTFLAIMSGLGGVLALVGGGFFAKIFLLNENPIGLVLLPVLALGLWLTRLFWPRAPKPYDPARYTEASITQESAPEGESDTAMAENEGSVTTR